MLEISRQRQILSLIGIFEHDATPSSLFGPLILEHISVKLENFLAVLLLCLFQTHTAAGMIVFGLPFSSVISGTVAFLLLHLSFFVAVAKTYQLVSDIQFSSCTEITDEGLRMLKKGPVCGPLRLLYIRPVLEWYM